MSNQFQDKIISNTSLVNSFPAEMFVISYHHFRNVMCSTKYTTAQKDSAWGGLCEDYIRCKLTPRLVQAFVAMEVEWSMRRGCDRESGGAA